MTLALNSELKSKTAFDGIKRAAAVLFFLGIHFDVIPVSLENISVAITAARCPFCMHWPIT